MKTIAASILLAIIWMATPGSVLADGDAWNSFADIESRLLVLINTARANPIAAMQSCGVDPASVLAAFPDRAQALENGMPPLTSDGRLKSAARAHTADMCSGNFYGHGGSDGLGYGARIETSGYSAQAIGETLGLLSFFNYMDPVLAAENIFRNMLQDELNPAIDVERNILNPWGKDIGIGFGAGRMSLGGQDVNAYLVTCNFASPAADRLETELLLLMNQARMDPFGVARSMGLDMGQILADQPEFGELIKNGLPPLAFQKNLRRAADLHTQDMLQNSYFSHISPDGATPEDRIWRTGYVPEASGESIASKLTGGWVDSGSGARELFETLFRAEMRGEAPRNILNPQFRDVGIRYQRVEKESAADGNAVAYHLMTCDFGASVASDLTLSGVVYRDADGNGLYSPGEGIPGLEIQMEGPLGSERVTTNETGEFARKAVSGFYAVTVYAGDQQLFHGVEVAQRNESLWLLMAAE